MTDGDTVVFVDNAAVDSSSKGKGKEYSDDTARAEMSKVEDRRYAPAPFIADGGVHGSSGAIRRRADDNALDEFLPPVLFASYERYFVIVARNEVLLYLRSNTVTE